MSFTSRLSIDLVHGGKYRPAVDVSYHSANMDRDFLFKKGFIFSPSIPILLSPLVPENSDTVAASLPHDWMYWHQVTTRKEADSEWKAEMEHRDVSWHVVWRSYTVLRLFGWMAWRSNQKRKEEGGAHKG